ncbi:hypothetical protein ColLi_08482 [Colletotrichum liriopes]|uniref:Uncharacterized protein n=1 Tax=Colletotrichum liriopes TaxID=708192 RepID=A0AA37LUU1_9PEZI|nr:hypothetical protein ColLi_08482 [Colletotrichum liriopes]
MSCGGAPCPRPSLFEESTETHLMAPRPAHALPVLHIDCAEGIRGESRGLGRLARVPATVDEVIGGSAQSLRNVHWGLRVDVDRYDFFDSMGVFSVIDGIGKWYRKL